MVWTIFPTISSKDSFLSSAYVVSSRPTSRKFFLFTVFFFSICIQFFRFLIGPINWWHSCGGTCCQSKWLRENIPLQPIRSIQDNLAGSTTLRASGPARMQECPIAGIHNTWRWTYYALRYIFTQDLGSDLWLRLRSSCMVMFNNRPALLGRFEEDVMYRYKLFTRTPSYIFADSFKNVL